ncbi:WD repeat and HMG-box DNA-binding protein 1 [Cylas formicarius]|uniref:WD repeat and HMG-box DNA-binding protein 1 n=1 Tax=Cylas formicarius TaxID=197179 RepID=UPI0029587258|nr:WD repeat and HMG-box DNA-binding protein 1 [Cylas formicarius]
MTIIHEPLRYAHEEGHTDVCYAHDGESFVTCGADGDIRIWSIHNSDDPHHVCIGEWALSVCQKEDKWYVATSNNDIQILSHPEGSREGVLDRYTAPVNQIVVCKSRNIVAVACEDMEVKLLNLETKTKIGIFTDLRGPCLSVAICPNGKKLAAASGDGNLRVWDVESSQLVKEVSCFPKTNSFANAKLLCRIDFDKVNGKYLAYPHETKVVLLNTTDWSEHYLNCEDITSPYSIVQFSSCNKYMVASSIEGDFVIWEVLTKQIIKISKHEKGLSICGLMWNPKNNGEIVYTDVEGQLGIMSKCLLSEESTISKVVDEDGFMENEVNFEDVQFEDDEDNDNVVSVEKLKQQYLGSPESELKEFDERSSRVASPRPRSPEVPLQPPFMPGSTPEHLDPRYFCWNEVGIVKSYGNSADDELASKSIEVEFHDVTFHNSMMMPNYQDYTMGCLSKGALVVANSSQLIVVPLLASTKDWILKFEENEEVVLVAASENLVCCAMSNYIVRICSLYGTQRAVVSIPGPIVSMAAFKTTLLVAYHFGGIRNNDQCINIKLITVDKSSVISKDLGASLGPESTLSWLGFSDAGTPAMVDSLGMLNLYPQNCNVWIPCCDFIKHRKSPGDGFFVTSIFESYQAVTGIKCKGSMYPVFIPRPTVCELPLEPPFVEPNTEKTQMESNLFAWSILNVADIDRKYKETALKTFALACKNDLDQRAFEFMEIIGNPQILNLGLKYATRLDKRRLAEKLTELAAKLINEEDETDVPISEVHTPNNQSVIKPPAIRRLTLSSTKRTVKKNAKTKDENDGGSVVNTQESLFNEEGVSVVDKTFSSQGSEPTQHRTPDNPFLKRGHSNKMNPLSLTDTLAGVNYAKNDLQGRDKVGEKRKLGETEPEERKGHQKKINNFFVK